MAKRFTLMTRRYTKWTKEKLEPAVASSRSMREVLKQLGLHYAGGTSKNINDRILEYGIDTSHFVGKGWAKNQTARSRKFAKDFLVIGHFGDPKVSVERIRRSLDEIGRKRVCVLCGLDELWNDKPLVLQIDHINGNSWDNSEGNLRYLCPNCHSQTDTFGIRNRRGSIPTAEETVREAVQ